MKRDGNIFERIMAAGRAGDTHMELNGSDIYVLWRMVVWYMADPLTLGSVQGTLDTQSTTTQEEK